MPPRLPPRRAPPRPAPSRGPPPSPRPRGSPAPAASVRAPPPLRVPPPRPRPRVSPGASCSGPPSAGASGRLRRGCVLGLPRYGWVCGRFRGRQGLQASWRSHHAEVRHLRVVHPEQEPQSLGRLGGGHQHQLGLLVAEPDQRPARSPGPAPGSRGPPRPRRASRCRRGGRSPGPRRCGPARTRPAHRRNPQAASLRGLVRRVRDRPGALRGAHRVAVIPARSAARSSQR